MSNKTVWMASLSCLLDALAESVSGEINSAEVKTWMLTMLAQLSLATTKFTQSGLTKISVVYSLLLRDNTYLNVFR